MMSEEYMLTTIDNPYNPFTDYEKWEQFDNEKGYFTMSLLDRIAKTSDGLSEPENIAIRNDAINDFISLDLLGLYVKVKESDEIIPINYLEINNELLKD